MAFHGIVRRVAMLFAIGAFCAGAAGALAAPIVYTFSGKATGTLNGVPFTSAPVIVDASADTTGAALSTSGYYCNNLTRVAFSIAGVGSGTVTDPLGIFSNPGTRAAGIQRGCGGLDWIDVYHSAFITDQLAAALGPVTGTPLVQGAVNTSAGVLAISSSQISTFQASTAPSPSITITPTALTFAARTVGTTSAPQTATLTNIGPGVLQIDSVSLTGDFAYTTNCSNTVAAGATCIAAFTFKPLAAGPRTGTATMISNASGSPHTVSLSGTGLEAPAPVIHVSPSVVDFVPQPIGFESPMQVVSVTNDGNATLNFGANTLTGSFVLRPVTASASRMPCGASLVPKASCVLGVAFRPALEGPVAGFLLVMGNAPQGVVALFGTGIVGPAPRTLGVPDRLDFEPQPVGTRSAGMAMTIINESPAVASLTELSATGDFSVSDTCTTIAAREDCLPLVFFQPAALGVRTGTLTLRTLADAEPYIVNLAGTATFNPVPELLLSASRLGFGNALIGTATPMALTLANIGMVPVALDGIAAIGDYLIGGNCADTIAVGASCTVNVRFFPRMRGQQGGALEIRSNAEGSPHRVQLSGVGCSVPSMARSRAQLDPCSP